MSEIMVFSHDYLDLIFFTTPVLWIISGLILLLSFGIGLLGMARENVFAIFAEGVIMLLAGNLQAVSRSILDSSTPKTKEDIADLHKVFRKILATYQPHAGDHTFDILQKELSCCGVVDHQDWTWERVPADLRQKGYFANPIYPSSCCPESPTSSETNYFEQHVCLSSALEEAGHARAGLQMHAVGCLPAFVDFIKEKTDFLLPFVLVSATLLILFSFLTIWYSFVLDQFLKQEAAFRDYCETYGTRQIKTKDSSEDLSSSSKNSENSIVKENSKS